MAGTARPVTAEEFARIPDDDFRYELVAGHVVRMSPVGGRHGVLASRLAVALGGWVDGGRLGVVAIESGFMLSREPDTVRGPDVAFVRAGRIPGGGIPVGFWSGAPDLAVEIRLPGDGSSALRAKVDEYLASGAHLVWIVDPDERTVTSCTRHGAPAEVGPGEELSGGEVLPGFRLAVDALFH